MNWASHSLDDAAPAFIVDAAAGAIVAANAAGWKAWGLPPATEPVAVDGAMPALQRLRELAGGSAEPLVLWTARGVLRLDCRIEPLEGGATFLVRASLPTAEAAPSAQRHDHPRAGADRPCRP